MTNREFFAAAEWEGGLYEMARHGLGSEDLDDAELAALWTRYVAAVEIIEDIGYEISKLVRVDSAVDS